MEIASSTHFRRLRFRNFETLESRNLEALKIRDPGIFETLQLSNLETLKNWMIPDTFISLIRQALAEGASAHRLCVFDLLSTFARTSFQTI